MNEEQQIIDVTLRGNVTGGRMGGTLLPTEALVLDVLKHVAQAQGGNPHVRLTPEQFLTALWDRVVVATVNLKTLGDLEGAPPAAVGMSSETQTYFDAKRAVDHNEVSRQAAIAAQQATPRRTPLGYNDSGKG